MKRQTETEAIVSIILSLIKLAANEVLEIYKSDLAKDVWQKADDSPLTLADITANKIITSGLSRHFSYPTLSEESVDNLGRLNSNRVWIVDPLDGTKEFINKNDEFTINIALIENNRPIAGVVAVPAQDIIFYASACNGAFVIHNGQSKKIKCSTTEEIKAARLFISRSHLNTRLKSLLDKYELTNLYLCGSSLKYCSVAAGQSEASLRKTPLMEWDICASDCILSEAGGKLTDFTGKELTYNKANPIFNNGIVASNGLLHHKLLSMVEKL